MVRWKLVGRVLVAIGGALVAGAGYVQDGAPSSPRGLLLLLAGIYMVVGEVLVLYGDAEAAPVPPS